MEKGHQIHCTKIDEYKAEKLEIMRRMTHALEDIAVCLKKNILHSDTIKSVTNAANAAASVMKELVEEEPIESQAKMKTPLSKKQVIINHTPESIE